MSSDDFVEFFNLRFKCFHDGYGYKKHLIDGAIYRLG